MSTIDLDAYFARIGYTGPRAATLEVLRELIVRHTQSIPFENLNPLLRWPVRLDAASLEDKLIRSGRGGYCFEQNLLFSHVLGALGFTATGLAARVLWNAPEGAITPRGHMLLRVDLDGEPFVADVGFGAMTLTGPLRLEAGLEQATPHEPFRLLLVEKEFLMQGRIGDTWKTLYRFDLTPHYLVDYEVTSWYLSNHPASHFVTGLVATRPVAGRRYALRNAELAVHHLNGPTERRQLTSGAELRAVLTEELGLRLPEAPELAAALDRLASRG